LKKCLTALKTTRKFKYLNLVQEPRRFPLACLISGPNFVKLSLSVAGKCYNFAHRPLIFLATTSRFPSRSPSSSTSSAISTRCICRWLGKS